MFVSSYATYINTITPNKTTTKAKENTTETKYSVFSSKLPQQQNITQTTIKPCVDYIAKSNAFYNKFLLDYQQEKSKSIKEEKTLTPDALIKKFSSTNSIENISSLYAQNMKKFSIMKKPSVSLEKTVPFSNDDNTHIAQEKILRAVMINTYVENEKYFTMSA